MCVEGGGGSTQIKAEMGRMRVVVFFFFHPSGIKSRIPKTFDGLGVLRLHNAHRGAGSAVSRWHATVLIYSLRPPLHSPPLEMNICKLQCSSAII